jgi:hypothetical protein
MTFIEYSIHADALYIGERMKGNIFKPCINTIPFSQISGALNAKLGRTDFKAVGILAGNSEFNRTNYLTYSPRDRNSGISKLPLQVEFLSNVSGKVFIVENEASKYLSNEFEIFLGGLKSKGFGRCTLRHSKKIADITPKKGLLHVRIPLEEKDAFYIREIKRPVYGYLFKPIPNTFTGNYVISLFEGSEVVAPSFLLRR